ncbi:MAG: glycosyltransferase family 4 protein [Clostridia bacterium]|nr:glycosyltransferase family 4 protein [Clostridia bacterium]
MKKVLLTASVEHHFNAFHFPLIDIFHENGYAVEIAAHDVMGGKHHRKLKEKTEKIHDIAFERSPFSLKNKEAYRQLKKVIDENDYDIINCNTPVASIITRLAARKCRKKETKVVYTAHGFHFYKGAPKLNWLLFYPLEKAFGKLFTDCIITICDEDEANARKHKLCKNIRRIHGVGVNSERFVPAYEETKQEMRKEYELDADAKVCLCTGELNANKNQQMFISALPQVVKENPGFRLMLAGIGDKEDELRGLAKNLGVEENVMFLGFRTDIDKLLTVSDFICAGSYREGLPVNIIEGMLSAKPAVVSYNRGHNELVEDGVSGFFVDFGDTDGVATAFNKLCSDTELCGKMGKAAYERSEKYSCKSVEKELRAIYNEFIK